MLDGHDLMTCNIIFHQHTYGDLARITCHVFLVASSTARTKRVDASAALSDVCWFDLAAT